MKGNQMAWMFGGVILLAIAAVFSVMWATGQFAVTGEADEGVTGAVVLTGSEKAEFCANNPSLDLSMRVEDGLASTKSYLNATVYVQNLEDMSIVEYAIDSASGSFDTESDALDCLNEEGYRIWVKADETGGDNSDDVITLSPEELSSDPVRKTIVASQFSGFNVKCYDNIDRAKCKEVTTNSTDYVTGTAIQFGDNTGDGEFDGSSADSLDVTFTIRPNVTSKAYGEKLYIAVDCEDESNLADWDEELTIVEFDGVELSDVGGSISSNEARALNSYEHIYALPESFGIDSNGNKDTEASIRVYLEPEADETSNDYDVTIRLVARGDSESSETDEILEDVGFGDDSSRTALYTAHTVELVVN